MGTSRKRPCSNCGRECYGTVCKSCRYGARGSADPAVAAEWDHTEDGDIATIRSISDRITTVDQALAHAAVDPAVWEVYRQTVKCYQSPNREGTRQLFAIHVYLRRKVPARLAAAFDMVMERMRRHTPRTPKPPTRRRIRDPHMIEFSPADLHLGKLAWAQETGDNYDLAIAERVFEAALEDALVATRGFEIESFLLPLGNDFFHVDNWKNETSSLRAKMLDIDSRYPRMFDIGVAACVRAIDKMAAIAPVRVLWIPGNHDYVTSFHLCRVLEAWYRGCRAVEVDVSPAARKYVEYGCVLLGLTHGCTTKAARLPTLMATEAAEAWGRTTWHEIHLGHVHIRRALETLSVQEHEGVVMRVLPSMSGTDFWHYEHGFVGGRKSAETYLWSRRDGYRGHFSSNIDPKVYK